MTTNNANETTTGRVDVVTWTGREEIQQHIVPTGPGEARFRWHWVEDECEDCS